MAAERVGETVFLGAMKMLESIEQVTAQRSWHNPTTYVLTVRSTPHEIDERARLKRALKMLLRRFGFRVLKVERTPDMLRRSDGWSGSGENS